MEILQGRVKDKQRPTKEPKLASEKDWDRCRGVSLTGVKVSEEVSGRHLSLVFRVGFGLLGCRSQCCRRFLWPSSAWRRRHAWSAVVSSLLPSSDGPQGPGTSPWWVGYVHPGGAPPGPPTHLLHLRRPLPLHYRPGGCHSPRLLVSLVKEEEVSYHPNPAMVRWGYKMKTDSGFIVSVGEKKILYVCTKGIPCKKRENIGRNKRNDEPKSKNHQQKWYNSSQ